LRRRVAATRWPSPELATDRSQGVQLVRLQALVRHWMSEYDWRMAEANLNALPQFTTEIDGVDIHFIHVKSPHENALPLIMTHGWPGLVIERDLEDQLSAESEQERAARDAVNTFTTDGSGYFLEQSTRPQTIGYALLDSPVGLGGLVARPGHGQLLQDFPRVRRRRAGGQSPPGQLRRQHHAVLADGHRRLGRPVVLGEGTGLGRSPCGRPGSSGSVARSRLHHVPDEIFRAPRSWVEASYPNLAYFNEVDKGGHFAASEQPELFSQEIRAAFRSLR
jgi:hypothetical protein